MIWYPTRILAPLGVIAGLLQGCAHGSTPESAQAPSPAPPQTSPSIATSRVIPEQPVASLEQMLEGRVPGVLVSRAAGGGISVQIRGPSSFYLTNEPLFVIDDVPIEPGPNGTLSWLRPQDIASIAVLRDPSVTAIYGVRGANGVILIKTKGVH